MKSTILVAGIGLLILFGTGCDKLRSRDALNHGVQAYKGAHYTEAVDYFKNAVQLDPDNTMPRLYLATAYMSQYIPGADSPENIQLANEAKDGIPKGSGEEPIGHHRARFAGFAQLSAGPRHAGPGCEAEEAGRGQGMVPEADRGRSAEQGRLSTAWPLSTG